MPSSIADVPVTTDELPALFSRLPRDPAARIAIAVSGGSDSVCLLVLFAEWLHQMGADPARHIVLTVDHGLRAASAAEARIVAGQAGEFGFAHAILRWADAKPKSGVQAAARQARYRLMRDYMAPRGIGSLLLAHTRDDQAETLLMRLARGSGLDGLAAMATVSEVAEHDGRAGLRIFRPLLGLAKERLQATLRLRGISWIEDPSNADTAFERVRWRAHRSALAEVGLANEAIAASATRLQRVRAAVEAATDAFCAPELGAVRTDPSGFFDLDPVRLCRVPEEIALRTIGRCVAAAGGSQEPVPLSGLESVVSHLLEDRSGGREAAWTLARARIAARASMIRITRELGRTPLPKASLNAGDSLFWDGRFWVETAASASRSLEVRALGKDGLAKLKRAGRAFKGAPSLLLAPSLWKDGSLLAVPVADYWAEERLRGMARTEFVGLRYNSECGDKLRGPDLLFS